MSETLLRWLVRATLCTSAFAAQAQGAGSPPVAPATRPDPLDAKTDVPALSYRSSFARYRAFNDDKPLSWREANDAVARIGGWRVYAREAQQPEPAPSGTDAATSRKPGGAPADTPRPMPMPPGHGGHKSP
ncbi:MAG TPA: hypothetical protein PLB41_06570 [Rubrivivax sp.]|nr:hypothetical protein [Rubrivivax sp.]HPO20434.1 hypothetical protein [Rubrivivax sp.]